MSKLTATHITLNPLAITWQAVKFSDSDIYLPFYSKNSKNLNKAKALLADYKEKNTKLDYTVSCFSCPLGLAVEKLSELGEVYIKSYEGSSFYYALVVNDYVCHILN
jgi:hypothetical protein